MDNAIQDSKDLTILVTGATGTVGSQVVRALRERGMNVRAAVRSPDKATALVELGAEVVPFDGDDGASVEAALDGIDRLFALSPFIQSPLGALRELMSRARAAGVGFVLRMSAAGADAEAELALTRQHAEGEAIVADSGIPYAVIRPTFFMDNIVNYAGATIREHGAFYGASGGNGVSYISARDIGDVAAQILVEGERHAGQRYTLTGPEAITDDAIASKLSTLLSKPVRYVDLEPEQFIAGAKDKGTPTWMAEAVGGLERVKRAGFAADVSPVTEQLLGRAGEDVDSFLAREAPRLARG